MVAPKPAFTATPAAANGRAEVAGSSVLAPLAAILPTSADAHGRASSHARRRRSGQASRLAASSANDALPPGWDRSALETWVAPTKSAGAQGPSRSIAALP